MEIRFSTKRLFEAIQYNDVKKKIRRNRNINISKLDCRINYPVVEGMTFVHNGIEVRVCFQMSEHVGDIAFQDMSFEAFKCLPKLEVG